MSAKIFPLADVLQFRRESAETSGRYAAMSDAQLMIEAMKRARVELIDDASISAIEMSEAQQRMNRSLERAQALKEEIEARGGRT
jgi:sulfur transfer complex TusBCD TusB component (DsrH family)